MPTDWRDDYDAYLKRESQRSSAEYERQEAVRRQQEEQQKMRVHAERMAKHQARFRCHECGKPSPGPATVTTYGKPQPDSIDYLPSHTTKDWNRPLLNLCSYCKRFTCDEHFYPYPSSSMKPICKCCSDAIRAGKNPTSFFHKIGWW